MDNSNKKFFYGLAFIIAASATTRLWFWLYTNWTIEDAMIIARMARNLAQHGQFTFNLNEKISSSTAPLFGLASAGLSLTGLDPLNSARLIGLTASALTAAVIYILLCRFHPPAIAASGSVIYMFLPPVIAYSVSGMETSLYTLVCFLSLFYLTQKKTNSAILWACFAAMIRVDGILVLFTACIAAAWENRRRPDLFFRLLLPSIIIVLPYVMHWLYFGAWLPHSITAKAFVYKIHAWANLGSYLNRMFLAQPTGLVVYAMAIPGLAWCWKNWRDGLWFMVWYLIYHVFFILRAPLFDWYLQPPLAVLCLYAGIGYLAGIEWVLHFFQLAHWKTYAQIAAATALSTALLFSNIPYAQGKLRGQEYEISVRGAAGKWLAEHAKADDLIFTESLGYISYYAGNLHFVDWPGLASPKVPALISKNIIPIGQKEAYDKIINLYQPQFLVLRQNEWDEIDPTIKKEYVQCKFFPSPNNYDGVSYLMLGKECP